MRRIIVSTFALALAEPALAADLGAATPYNKAPAYVAAYQAAFSWTGNYFGVNLGGVHGNFDFTPSAIPALGGPAAPYTDTSSANNNAVVGGFQVGRNWQFGQWVVGLEHESQFTNLAGNITAGPAIAAPFAPGDNFNAKIDYLGAERVKLGYAWDRFLVYTAAGLETGEMDVTGNYASRGGLAAGAPLSSSDTHKFQAGYTVGIGAEYAVTDRVSFGVEYRYLMLNKATYNLGTVASATGAVSNVTTDVGLSSSEVLARLNVKFNGLGLPGF